MKTLIYSIFTALIIFTYQQAHGIALSIKTGVYDFTDEATRDFYKVAPHVNISCIFFDTKICSIDLTVGGSYTQIDYMSRTHHLFILPVEASLIFNIPSGPGRIKPITGFGLGMYYKMDYSASGDRYYHYTTYGYHFLAGVFIKIIDKLDFVFELQYNLCMTNTTESMILNALVPTAGVCFRL